MVDDYRLTREAQLQVAEGRYDRSEGRDESYRPVVFKDWLRSYEWEREPDPTRDDALENARAAVDACGDTEAEQLDPPAAGDGRRSDAEAVDEGWGWSR